MTLTVGAILVAIAVPSFRNFTQNSRLTGQQNSLVYSLNLARSEAIKRDSPAGVQVCASADQLNCNGAAWTNGWIVIDLTNNRVVQAVGPLGYNNTLTAGANLAVTFRADGSVSTPLAFHLCDSRGGGYARDIEVSTMGRVASSPTPGQSLNGVALACP